MITQGPPPALHRCHKLHATITPAHCEALRNRPLNGDQMGRPARPPQCVDCTAWMQWNETNTINFKPTREQLMPKTKRRITEEDRARYDAVMQRIKDVTGLRTQVELAEYLDIRQSSISDSKRRASIPADWLIKLWRKTTISPDWIMLGDDAGQRYAVPSDVTGQAVDAVAMRARIETEVRNELDHLHLEDLIHRIQDIRPDAEVRFPARSAKVPPPPPPSEEAEALA